MQVSWLAFTVLLSGVASFVAIGAFIAYRNRPGGSMWLGVLACMAIWSTSYGVGLFVFDLETRRLFELLMYLAVSFVSVFYLGFVLEYTGHGPSTRMQWLPVVGGIGVIFAAFVLTNPFHGLVLTDFTLDPVFGAATVTYARGPVFYLISLFTYVCVGLGMVLLFETMLRYGRPYRKHVGALALTPLFPAVAGAVWIFRLGPVPQVNLVPLAFLIHVVIDIYALYWSGMFEYEPATRRAGERAAIDDLASPVFVFDEADRLIDWNTAATTHIVEEDATVDRVGTAGRRIRHAATDLVELSEKARAAARSLDTDQRVETVTVRELVEDVIDRLDHDRNTGVVVDVPDELTLRTQPRVVSLVVSNLVENGLEHGSGIGLWLVRWGVTTLGGALEFGEAGRDESVVRLTVPDADGATTPTAVGTAHPGADSGRAD